MKLPYSSALNIDPGSSQAIYVQLANGIISFIQQGILKPGDKLLSVRKMAVQLKLHPKTIVAAYDEMMAQGWIFSKPRSGVFISENLPELKPKSISEISEREQVKTPSLSNKRNRFDLVINDGFPDYRLAPVESLLRFYKNAFYSGKTEKLSQFTDPAGSIRLRLALTNYLRESRVLKINPDNILVTRGAQMAIYIVASLLIKPGDFVYVGEPGYATASTTFEKLGAKLVKIPVDENGINIDLLEKNLKTKKPKLLYIIPHHHHPTTVTLSARRRMKLLSLIQEHEFFVLEDDYDYEFHYNHSPILPLASTNHNGYVLYVGSITKNLSYSIRAGYLVASEEILRKAVEYKRIMDIRGDLMLEEALAAIYENGIMQRHIRKSVKLYHLRRNLFCELLRRELGDKIKFTVPEGGMAVWAQFDKKYSLPEISSLAAGKGLWMADGSFYNTSGINYNSLRMGFASLNEMEISNVIRILAEIMNTL